MSWTWLSLQGAHVFTGPILQGLHCSRGKALSAQLWSSGEDCRASQYG